MSDQLWTNAMPDREWLALRCRIQGLLGLDHWTNIKPSDEQNDIGQTSFVNVGPTKCQRWPNE